MSSVLIIFNILFIAFLILWIPLIGIGIYRLKKYGAKPVGIAMTVFGGVWAMGAFAVGGITLIIYMQIQAYSVPTFDPATYDGPTGKIEFPFSSDIQLSARGDDGAVVSTKANGDTVELPTGSYSIYSYGFQRKDEDGNVWSLWIKPKSQERITFVEGRISKLDMGPPITTSIESNQASSDTFSLSLNSKDKNGNRVLLNCSRAGKTKFQILSMDDRVLQEGSFEYG